MADIASMSIEELGRYVVTRPWWRWRRGITSVWAHDETDDNRPMLWLVRGPVDVGPHGDGSPEFNRRCFPYLSDAATVGALHGAA